MPHGVAEVGQNIPFLIQLSNFTDDEILWPKGTNVGICDDARNEQYVFSVEGDLDRNQSTSKEDLAALHLTKKAERRVAPPVTADVLMLSDLDDEKKREDRKVLCKF